ncbi:unnamed protein product, partial [Brassica oleracea var. botrytis]
MASLFVHLFTSDVTKYLSFNAVDEATFSLKGRYKLVIHVHKVPVTP